MYTHKTVLRDALFAFKGQSVLIYTYRRVHIHPKCIYTCKCPHTCTFTGVYIHIYKCGHTYKVCICIHTNAPTQKSRVYMYSKNGFKGRKKSCIYILIKTVLRDIQMPPHKKGSQITPLVCPRIKIS